MKNAFCDEKYFDYRLFLLSFLTAPAQSGSITNIDVLQLTSRSGLGDVSFNLNGDTSSYDIHLDVSFDGARVLPASKIIS